MSDQVQQWYGGLPLTSIRQLDDDEVQRLLEMRREARGELWKYGAGFGALAVAAIFMYLFLENRSVSPLMILIGLLSLLSGYRGKRLEMLSQFVRASRRDLGSRNVVICESGDTRIEVLAESCALWTHNGVQKLEIVLVTRTSTAVVPEHALMAANFVRPIDEEAATHQRPLSDGELREIERYVPSVPTGRTLGALLAAAAIIGGVIGAFRLHGGMITLTLIGTVAAWRTLPPAISILRTQRSVRRDIDARCAVIVRRNADNVTFEVLPYSGLLWTENGEPAGWRKVIVTR